MPLVFEYELLIGNYSLSSLAFHHGKSRREMNSADNSSDHHQTLGNVIARVFEPALSGSNCGFTRNWQEDDSLQPHHPLFHIWSYRRMFCAVKWVLIQLGRSENQLLLLMLFKFSFGMLSGLAEQKLFLCVAITSISSNNTKAASVLQTHRTNLRLYWIFSSIVILQRSDISDICTGSNSKLHFYE